MASALCQAKLPRPGVKRRFAAFSPEDLNSKRKNAVPESTQKAITMFLIMIRYDKFVIRFGLGDDTEYI